MFQVYQAYKYFEQIKSGDIDFLTFINKGLKSLNEEDKVLYRDVVKSTVNRYYFLKWECERLELDDNARNIFPMILKKSILKSLL